MQTIAWRADQPSRCHARRVTPARRVFRCGGDYWRTWLRDGPRRNRAGLQLDGLSCARLLVLLLIILLLVMTLVRGIAQLIALLVVILVFMILLVMCLVL